MNSIFKKTPIDFSPNELTKLFTLGEHVKVIAGKHQNETGHILNYSGKFANILSDMNFRELTVKLEDMKTSKTKSSGVDQSGQYQYGDMVVLE